MRTLFIYSLLLLKFSNSSLIWANSNLDTQSGNNLGGITKTGYHCVLESKVGLISVPISCTDRLKYQTPQGYACAIDFAKAARITMQFQSIQKADTLLSAKFELVNECASVTSRNVLFNLATPQDNYKYARPPHVGQFQNLEITEPGFYINFMFDAVGGSKKPIENIPAQKEYNLNFCRNLVEKTSRCEKYTYYEDLSGSIDKPKPSAQFQPSSSSKSASQIKTETRARSAR